MRKVTQWRGLVAAFATAALAVPSLAAAQVGGGDAGGYDEGEYEQEYRGGQGGATGGGQGGAYGGGFDDGMTAGQLGEDAAVEGVVRGVVTGYDVEQGVVNIRTAEGAVTLRGQPGQLAGLRIGEQASIEYAQYGDRRWVMSGLGNQGRQFGRMATVTGNVIDVNRTTGVISLQTAGDQQLVLRAHPARVEGLLENQYVTIRYQQIGARKWIQQIRSATGGGAGGGAAGGVDGGGVE